MRRILLTSVLLLPMIAHGQAPTAAGSKTSTLAELSLPGTPAVSSALAMASSKGNGLVSELIHTRTVDDFASAQAFNSIPTSQSSSPNLKTASVLGLAPQDLAKEPATFKVILDATIDANGVPRNISVSHSAGKIIDDKAIAAVSQYRFQPALIDRRPTESAVSIAIKIQR